MPVNGSKMGQGMVGLNPIVKFVKPPKGTKTVDAMNPMGKKKKRLK